MTRHGYPWAEGDRLDDRNTYFYTPSTGSVMLEAWTSSRQEALRELPEAVAPQTIDTRQTATFSADADGTVVTAELLAWLWNRVSAEAIDEHVEMWLTRLVRKFEITKRFHEGYDERFRATDRTKYADLSLYTHAASVLAAAARSTRNLTFLNGLLKIVDTACAHRSAMTNEQQATLAYVIGLEAEVLVACLGPEHVV